MSAKTILDEAFTADHLVPVLIEFRADHRAFAILLESTGAPADMAAAAADGPSARGCG